MKRIVSISRQVEKVADIRIESIAEYVLDNGNNLFEFKLSKVIDKGETVDFKSLGIKKIEFQSYNSSYVKELKAGKTVVYTKELIEKLVKLGLKK